MIPITAHLLNGPYEGVTMLVFATYVDLMDRQYYGVTHRYRMTQIRGDVFSLEGWYSTIH